MNRILFSPLLIGASLLFGADAIAQDYPSKPIRLVTPFAAGGNTDILARMLAERMSRSMGQAVVVDNKVGAGGSLGATEVAKAAPDGYTLLLATSSTHAINPAVYSNLKYDVVKDFAPITTLASSEYALVVPGDSPFKTVNDLLKANAKETLRYASNGNGTTSHLASELFALRARTKFIHVPYKSSSPAMTDLMGGQVDFLIDNTSTALQNAKTGRLRIIATTGSKRAVPTKDVPTMMESGVEDYEVIGWWAVLTSSGTPPAIVERLNKEIARAVAQPDMQARMVQMGNDPYIKSPSETRSYIAAQLKHFKSLVDTIGLKID